MINQTDYLKNPTACCLDTYRKHLRTSLRRDTVVLKDEKYNEVVYRDFIDTKYIKSIHYLQSIKMIPLNEHYFIHSVGFDELGKVVEIFNSCYEDVKVTLEEINKHWNGEDVDRDYWCFLYSKKDFILHKETKIKDYQPIGLCIVDYNKEIGEASLFCLGIKPQYRGKGLGLSLLKEVMLRASSTAKFMVTSYPVKNDFGLDNFFKQAGFTDETLWHYLKKNPNNESIK